MLDVLTKVADVWLSRLCLWVLMLRLSVLLCYKQRLLDDEVVGCGRDLVDQLCDWAGWWSRQDSHAIPIDIAAIERH